ncbi:hypothetical protein [Fluviicola taffensis]|uniref:Uncharacterized protein n=1 Tax=Fluviicola taffensis (strain DSM 16823 / NCIMB 13979 / RW262) TaxID=755732 RepID=F2IF79_FLUTR|nr:hypothetical protein [Fluviicola taffensis]AEA43553.1 hypothetical protein Fluta_1561 [Fluviicola taffensis DSM 16823]
MEELHERLFDLIESKSFNKLTKEEKSFVLEHLSEEEYELQRKIISTTSDMEEEHVEPLPLVIPVQKKGFFTKSIPLYQAIISVAAMLVVFIAIWPRESQSSLKLNFGENPVNISVAGTPSVQIIHDTVFQKIPMFSTVTKIVYDTITLVQEVLKQPDNRQLAVGRMIPQPEISKQLLESKSQPYKDDKVAQFLPNISVVNTMK